MFSKKIKSSKSTHVEEGLLLVMNVQGKPLNNYLENLIVPNVIFFNIDVTGHVDNASQTIIGPEEISEKIISDDSTHNICFSYIK